MYYDTYIYMYIIALMLLGFCATAGGQSKAANETLTPQEATWGLDAEKELRKIPFFVRGKAKRNTERFAIDRGVSLITVETLYDAKAHYGR